MAPNPYAIGPDNGRQVPGATMVWGGNGRYAVRNVPESTDPDYTVAFSPELKSGGSSDGSALPDSLRIGQRKPPVRNWNAPDWQRRLDSDFLERHSVDHYADPWRIQEGRIPPPRVPYWEQDRPPSRWTQEMSPTGYLFQTEKHIPRNAAEIFTEETAENTGIMHFTMATHRREYAIMTQQPRGRVGRNTYRADPEPWDKQLYTPPPAPDPGVAAGLFDRQRFRAF